jgi:hypothetical protein
MEFLRTTPTRLPALLDSSASTLLCGHGRHTKGFRRLASTDVVQSNKYKRVDQCAETNRLRVSRPAIKRIVFTWRGLPGWTYLILDFPVGIRAVGIEVSDQVARKECVSIFDAKRGAESRQPRTELTPMCFGACRRKLPKWRVPASNLGPPAGNHFPRMCKEFSNFQMFSNPNYGNYASQKENGSKSLQQTGEASPASRRFDAN